MRPRSSRRCYKMAMDWKLALPLHPEYRTLPMVLVRAAAVANSVLR